MAAQPPAAQPQPNMAVITASARTLLEEIPAQAILDAINDLRNDLTSQTRRLVAVDNNAFARTSNSLCQGTNEALVPLVHGITGAAIPNFPGTIADLNALAGGDLSAILTALGRPINGTVSQRQSRLLIAIGITKLAVAR